VLTPAFTKQFQRDIKRLGKRGKDMAKFKLISTLIINEQPLSPKHKDHILIGNYVGRRECHIEPDWLLVYKIKPGCVIFERTGSHADLFK